MFDYEKLMWWGSLSLINAGLAQAKGKSGLRWWLLSLILGPIATLLIVIVPWNGRGDITDSDGMDNQ